MSLSARSSTRATATAAATALLGLLAACGGSDDANNGAVGDGTDGATLSDVSRVDTWNPLDVIPPADTRVADTATPPDAADVATPDASARSCDLPWGGTVPDGASVTAYPAASVACGGSCASEERFCDDGALSGSATAQSCFVVACEACPAPWGGSVAHGASVTAYAAATAGCGAACLSEVRSCADGVLSGSYPAQACTATPCAPCALPWGGSIAHGAFTTAYASSSAACGGSCTSEVRTCIDGALSGSYGAQVCSVTPCASCALPWGGGRGLHPRHAHRSRPRFRSAKQTRSRCSRTAYRDAGTSDGLVRHAGTIGAD